MEIARSSWAETLHCSIKQVCMSDRSDGHYPFLFSTPLKDPHILFFVMHLYYEFSANQDEEIRAIKDDQIR